MSLRKSPTVTPARLEAHPHVRDHRSVSLPGKDASRTCRLVRKFRSTAPRDSRPHLFTERSRDVIENKRSRDSSGAVRPMIVKIEVTPLIGKEMLKMKVDPAMCMKTKCDRQNVRRVLTENTRFYSVPERKVPQKAPRFPVVPTPAP